MGLDKGLREEHAAQSNSERHLIYEQEHHIPRSYINRYALNVIEELDNACYPAYLVGGCIRDILLGRKPKDFDVTTAAYPEKVATIFKRSRLIGRRFKLVHVRFGREIVEVATFRASHNNQDSLSSNQSKQCSSGMILRDNVYGTIEDDVIRRDFTVNALYYCPKECCIYDFVGGYKDLQQKNLKVIGNPVERYTEDPVRMLRAARFAAKLGFKIEPESEAPIKPLGYKLKSISPARLFDEALKLLQSGYGVASYQQLQRLELFGYLFPQVQKLLDSAEHREMLESIILQALTNTDKRLAQGKSVTPAFLIAAILWYPLKLRIKQIMQERKMSSIPALYEASRQILSTQAQATSIPKRFSLAAREIWEMQLRLPQNRGNKALRLLEHSRFRAGYDLLLLREASGELPPKLGKWWTNLQQATPQERNAMIKSTANNKNARKHRYSNSKK